MGFRRKNPKQEIHHGGTGREDAPGGLERDQDATRDVRAASFRVTRFSHLHAGHRFQKKLKHWMKSPVDACLRGWLAKGMP